MADVFEHEGDFGAESVDVHRPDRLDVRRHGGAEAGAFSPTELVTGCGEIDWLHC